MDDSTDISEEEEDPGKLEEKSANSFGGVTSSSPWIQSSASEKSEEDSFKLDTRKRSKEAVHRRNRNKSKKKKARLREIQQALELQKKMLVDLSEELKDTQKIL